MSANRPIRLVRVGRFLLSGTAVALGCTLLHVGQTLAQGAMGVVTGRITHQTAAAQTGSIMGRLVSLKLDPGPTRGQLRQARYQPQGHIFLQLFSDGQLLVWDFGRSAQIDELRLPGDAVPIHYDVALGRVLALENGRLIRVARGKDGKPVTTPLLENGVTAATASADGQAIFVGMASGEVLRLNSAGAAAWRQRVLEGSVREIVASANAQRVTVLAEGGSAQALDGSGRKTFAIQDLAHLGGYDRSGRQFHAARSGGIVTVTPQGAATRQEGAPIAALAVNDSGDSLLMTSGDGKLAQGGPGRWTPVEGEFKQAFFIGGKRYLTVKGDGLTHLRSTDLAHYLLALVPGESGWVIVDHEGRYDGSVDGTKDVRWTGEAATLKLDQFFDRYFQPGLLAAYVNAEEGKALGAAPAKPTEGVYLPAKLELEFPGGSMKAGVVTNVVAVAESQGGALLEDIRLFHNGKRLPAKAKVGSQKVEKDGRILMVQAFQFVPEAGANEVFGEVRNFHGISSRSEVKREVTDGFRSPGTLHIVGLGIDKYRLSKINLDFATADARAIVGKVSDNARQRYDKVSPQLVVNHSATRRGIKDLLAALEKMQPQDSLILMLAGHGDIARGEWYFLPHDVDINDITHTAISARDLQDALVNAPPKRIFLLVDACNSGSGIDSFNRYRSLQRRIAQQVGRDVGVTVLTATRRDQTAEELPELGHGVFSQVILDGLAGGADTTPNDGRVSVHELANYVARNFDERARPFMASLNLSQTPSHFVIGSDFLLTDVSR